MLVISFQILTFHIDHKGEIMIGQILTQADLDKHGLKPTGDIYGERTGLHCWKYYCSPKIVAILRENVDGTFLVRAWVPELRKSR